MKKSFLMLVALCFSATCFAGANFNSSTGALAISEVTVDGSAIYENVKLQMDMKQGTFTLQQANPKNIVFPIGYSESKYDFGLIKKSYGCVPSGLRQVTCMEKFVNPEKDQILHIFGDIGNAMNFIKNNVPDLLNNFNDQLTRKMYPGLFVDNLDNEYFPSYITAGDQSDISLKDIHLEKGIELEVRFVYNHIDPNATSLRRRYSMVGITEIPPSTLPPGAIFSADVGAE